MRTFLMWLGVGALFGIAMSLGQIANDLHEMRWTLLASQREASR